MASAAKRSRAPSFTGNTRCHSCRHAKARAQPNQKPSSQSHPELSDLPSILSASAPSPLNARKKISQLIRIKAMELSNSAT